MVTKNDIIKILKTIPDPELNISVWDLGLIYNVKVGKKGDVVIVMTLTSQGCPLFSMMEEPIKRKVKKLKGVKSVTIHLTFDPPWDTEKMSKKGKEELGLL
jgi:metal-sulfur cluster biosynthetic enzyme